MRKITTVFKGHDLGKNCLIISWNCRESRELWTLSTTLWVTPNTLVAIQKWDSPLNLMEEWKLVCHYLYLPLFLFLKLLLAIELLLALKMSRITRHFSFYTICYITNPYLFVHLFMIKRSGSTLISTVRHSFCLLVFYVNTG